jgi:hypothetical protein
LFAKPAGRGSPPRSAGQAFYWNERGGKQPRKALKFKQILLFTKCCRVIVSQDIAFQRLHFLAVNFDITTLKNLFLFAKQLKNNNKF